MCAGDTKGKFDLTFDWIILGLGEDGHVALLFSGKNHELEATDICTNSIYSETGEGRITLTMTVVNQVRQVILFVAGRNKANVVFEVIRKALPVKSCPASYVNLKNGLLQWSLDEEAGSLLQSKVLLRSALMYLLIAQFDFPLKFWIHRNA